VAVTPSRPVDVEVLFPFLVARQRLATRLHPRIGPVERADSSIGGMLWWPAGETWPVCDRHDGPLAYVPVVQVWARDVPLVLMRPGADVVQVAWCPTIHDDDLGYGTRPLVWWRDSSIFADVLAVPPPVDLELAGARLVPRVCRVTPEEVTEYPSPYDLPDEEADLTEVWSESPESNGLWYDRNLSAAPGSKVGGWPAWIDLAEWPMCAQGHRMDHLLTVASVEYDSASGLTWRPVELADPRAADSQEFRRPTGLSIGDAGDMRLFVCRQCEDWPTASVLQA
jgi:hypothetical protein